MLFTTVASSLFPVAIMAVPASKPAANDSQCRPVSYTLTEYTLAKSSYYYFVSFNLQSSYTADTRADDEVQAGANCEADGTEIHSSGNKCNIAGKRVEKLQFDLRGGSGDANYSLHHTWQCNGATWTSESDIELSTLDCQTDDDGTDSLIVKCTSKPVIFAPQKIRKTDEKKASGKAKAAKPTAEPTAKSADCPKCKDTPSS